MCCLLLTVPSKLILNSFPCVSDPLFLFAPQWGERNEQCRRLLLRDLLVAPLHRLTRYPLLLRNIAKRCQQVEESRGLLVVTEQVDASICEHQSPVSTSASSLSDSRVRSFDLSTRSHRSDPTLGLRESG